MDAQKISDDHVGFTPGELIILPQMDIMEYAGHVMPIAKEIEFKFQIHFIVPIIQSAHESRNGNSDLFREYCNAFGMTATQWWKDKGRPVANLPTFEYIKGQRVEMKREFCAYPDLWHSFTDWAERISQFKIYAKTYAFFKEGKAIDGIREMAGIYATDPAYAKMLTESYKSLTAALL